MANEIEVSATLHFTHGNTDEILQIAEELANVSTKKYTKLRVSVGTSEEAIPLGEVSSLGWFAAVNHDENNYIEIRMASGASNDHIKIPPGKAALFHFGSDVTAPYWIANTAACDVEYLLVSQ